MRMSLTACWDLEEERNRSRTGRAKGEQTRAVLMKTIILEYILMTTIN